jgi:hypothetical protein
MSDLVFVGVKSYRKGDEVDCVGVWCDRAQAVTDISKEHSYNPEFSEPEEGFWGTEEWSISLEEQTIRKRD